jgi:RNA polymerase sigma-70 factor (ECF subfamily)
MSPGDEALRAARAGDEGAFRRLVDPHRRELTAHCYRMSGSLHDAEDLLQESLLRAWKGLAAFEGRSSVRTWLYKVATSACLDAVDRRRPRALPLDLGPPADPDAPMPPPRLEPVWLEPCPEALYEDASPSPEARYGARESVALAFLTALQLLPARQRAVLILRDVLGWEAGECAELLDDSVASVNSALQRARATVASRAEKKHHAPLRADSHETASLLARYVRAWEEADVDALVALLHEDATLSMPPLPAWIRGATAIGASIRAMVLPPEARGRLRLVPTRANGLPALAAYQRDAASGEYRAGAIHVLEIAGDRIEAITAFLDPSLFASFGLPAAIA